MGRCHRGARRGTLALEENSPGSGVILSRVRVSVSGWNPMGHCSTGSYNQTQPHIQWKMEDQTVNAHVLFQTYVNEKIKKLIEQPPPPVSLPSITSTDIYLETFFFTSAEGPKHLEDLSHAWANKAHEIPAPVDRVNQDQFSCSVQRFLDWMDHACVNGISSVCMLTESFLIHGLFITTKLLAETNESSDPKLSENENPSYKSDTNLKVLPIDIEKSSVLNENSLCDKNYLTSQRHWFNSTKGSLVVNTKCNTTTYNARRNHKTSVWTVLFLLLLRLTSLAAAPSEVPIKKCCPDGQVLDGSASCIAGSSPSPFNSILRGLDPSKSNYRDHPVDMSLVSTGVSLPGRPEDRKLYKLEQEIAWLTVGGKLITSEFEAEFPHGKICVDRTMWGDRAAVMEHPCKGKLCLTLCCPHGQALVDDPTIEAAIDENVPKICGNFDWDWEVQFWRERDNAEITGTRNDDFVLREDVDHAGSFSCLSNCGGKKGTLGFADSTYSQVRLYSNGTLSGKLGDKIHLIENKRFCMAYGDPPNYDYGEADTGMRVTYMVCSQPKCPPSEDGVPDAAADKSVNLASGDLLIPLALAAGCIIVLVFAFLVAYAIHRKNKRSQDEHVNQPNSRGTDGPMEMRDSSGRDQVNIQTLSDLDLPRHHHLQKSKDLVKMSLSSPENQTLIEFKSATEWS